MYLDNHTLIDFISRSINMIPERFKTLILYFQYINKYFSFVTHWRAKLQALSQVNRIKFKVQGSVHHKYIPINIQQNTTLLSLFISGNCSTCFGWYLHPSSGAHSTVSTVFGTCQTVTATGRYSGSLRSTKRCRYEG